MVAEMLKTLKHVDLLVYGFRDRGSTPLTSTNFMSPQKINKLIMQGRLIPMIEKTAEGKTMLIGYSRKGSSRKSNQTFRFAKPVDMEEEQNTAIKMPEPLILS
jgi:hypothetical protein